MFFSINKKDGWTLSSSTYRSITDSINAAWAIFSEDGLQVFSLRWSKLAPLKISAMVWDRMPIKVNLERRNMLPQDTDSNCALCGDYSRNGKPFIHHVPDCPCYLGQSSCLVKHSNCLLKPCFKSLSPPFLTP